MLYRSLYRIAQMLQIFGSFQNFTWKYEMMGPNLRVVASRLIYPGARLEYLLGLRPEVTSTEELIVSTRERAAMYGPITLLRHTLDANCTLLEYNDGTIGVEVSLSTSLRSIMS